MSKNILIVDDEPAFLFSACLAMRLAGYGVGRAGNGEEAFNMILERNEAGDPFDLIILDIQMPVMNGVEFHDALIERNIHIPVVFITGYAVEGIDDQIRGKGYGDLLQKPFQFEELVQRVNDLVKA